MPVKQTVKERILICLDISDEVIGVLGASAREVLVKAVTIFAQLRSCGEQVEFGLACYGQSNGFLPLGDGKFYAITDAFVRALSEFNLQKIEPTADPLDLNNIIMEIISDNNTNISDTLPTRVILLCCRSSETPRLTDVPFRELVKRYGERVSIDVLYIHKLLAPSDDEAIAAMGTSANLKMVSNAVGTHILKTTELSCVSENPDQTEFRDLAQQLHYIFAGFLLHPSKRPNDFTVKSTPVDESSGSEVEGSGSENLSQLHNES